MSTLDSKVTSSPSTLAERIPPQAFFVGSAIFHYLGPSFAVLLFARVPVAGVAWLRIVSAALVFALWRRPWRNFFAASRRTRWTIVALGGVFASMNYSFYRAIAELPLGTVAAIEFVGPIVLALTGVRSRRNLAALILAVGGVYLLTEVRLAGAPLAFAWAFANAILFALYIVLAHDVARADPLTSPIDRLGASMIIAGAAISPIGLDAAIPALLDPIALGAGVAVGISSSVIPYVLDQLAMKRLPRATYALFVSLLPATAVIIGVIVLRQVPSPVESLGVLLVACGVALHRPAS
ncbi:EamA family transporter [Dyella choica]|uniref:EamA family transporter n=1 Tax=Dyella choica TaxID=1927959 RepID=A0A432M3M4_9GAMM|nr:EamA family transporter [Dyella choica]RUL73627.1 EamA family transporter [Dyella choica]